MANIEGLTPAQETHAKVCPKCKPVYESAMQKPRDWNTLATCKQRVADCIKDADRPRR